MFCGLLGFVMLHNSMRLCSSTAPSVCRQFSTERVEPIPAALKGHCGSNAEPTLQRKACLKGEALAQQLRALDRKRHTQCRHRLSAMNKNIADGAESSPRFRVEGWQAAVAPIPQTRNPQVNSALSWPPSPGTRNWPELSCSGQQAAESTLSMSVGSSTSLARRGVLPTLIGAWKLPSMTEGP